MKFMKLGSKPDTFQAEGNSVRCASSELATDVVVRVGDVRFRLHKFPLLPKSNRLKKLMSGNSDENPDQIQLVDFPGGPKAFEICAKFCYGITVTLNAYNVVAARCAAEYLEMTEDMERGNLILKIEIFLNSSVLRNWKDSIIVLQTTKSLLPWAENLKIVGRCIDSIASKTSADPSMITWSYTYNRKLATSDQIIPTGVKFPKKMESVPKDWWVEDTCELDIDLYKRVIVAIKSKGRMDGGVIGEALRTYTIRWLPECVDALVSEVHVLRNKSLVETIICLLPSDKGISCSCSFLVKLLKVAILTGVDDSSKEELVRGIGIKLDEASVSDLLILARPPQATLYDIELVQRLVDQFFMNEMNNGSCNIVHKNAKNDDGDFVLGHGSWLKVGKTVDGYLAVIAHDPNFSVSSFIKLARAILESARPIHDGLYIAVDAYLKEHKNLTKSEKKSLCGLIDVKKMTRDVAMHAAQNEQLPLRMVVQVLFFEQVKAAPRNWRKAVAVAVPERQRKQMDEMKMKEEENGRRERKGAQLLPSRSKRIFDKLWTVGKNAESKSKSSETSASSQSPPSIIKPCSRNRRHSIS